GWGGPSFTADTRLASAAFTYWTAPMPEEFCFEGESTPIFSGGRLLPGGGASVFKRAFAWAAGALGPDEDEPTIDPRVFCTAIERLGNDGSGTTSASTVTPCMPNGCTCSAGELSLGLTEMMMSGCFSPG